MPSPVDPPVRGAPAVRAELVAVGSELLGALRVDTNSLWLTRRLLETGVAVGARSTVADDRVLLESALRGALSRSEIVITTGGLGPTADDLTREAAATALGRRLVRDPALVEGLKARFARFGRVMSSTNEQQADVIEGGRALANPRGTAPGQVVEDGGRLLVLLPGPPGEMMPMFEEEVLPRLVARTGGRVVRTRVLRIAGMGESNVDEIAAPLYRLYENPRTTILGAAGQVELHLVGEGASVAEVEQRIEELARGLRARLADRIYSEDGRELPVVVGQLLRERGLTLAIAESCTGGLLTARLTDVPGSSSYVDRALVTYSNRAKHEELGIDPGLIARQGAVSEEVAAAMAAAVRRVAGTAVGIGITGIAGPDGGTPDKPVGLVFVAVDRDAGPRVRRCLFPGDRERVRFQATQVALEMLRRALLGLGELP